MVLSPVYFALCLGCADAIDAPTVRLRVKGELHPFEVLPSPFPPPPFLRTP